MILLFVFSGTSGQKLKWGPIAGVGLEPLPIYYQQPSMSYKFGAFLMIQDDGINHASYLGSLSYRLDPIWFSYTNQGHFGISQQSIHIQNNLLIPTRSESFKFLLGFSIDFNITRGYTVGTNGRYASGSNVVGGADFDAIDSMVSSVDRKFLPSVQFGLFYIPRWHQRLYFSTELRIQLVKSFTEDLELSQQLNGNHVLMNNLPLSIGITAYLSLKKAI
jgi:hypothetical protein